MNERIKELNTKATKWALDNYPPPVNTFEWEDLRNNKFAELIVAECCEIVGNYYGNHNKSGPLANTMILEIEEHFGVAE